MEKSTRTRKGENTWSSPRFHIAAGLLAVLLFACMHQVYLSRAHPDALYMDSLRLLSQLQQWEAGTLSTLDFWGQGSSHRGFVNQLFLLANVSLFDLDVLLFNRLTGVVIAAVSLILVLAWCGDNRRLQGSRMDAVTTVGVSITIAGLCHSWAGFELFTLDLGLPLWVKNLSFVAFFCTHAWLLSGTSRRPLLWSIALAVTAPVVILVVGMGWNFAFVGAVFALQLLAFIPAWRAAGRWYGVLPCVSLVASMALYLASGNVTQTPGNADVVSLSGDTPLIALYALGATLGNPAMITQRLPVWLIALGGACMLVGGVLASITWLRRGAPGSRLPLYLITYGALVAVSVTLARGAAGPGGVMASRYYMDIVLGLIGVVWLTVRELRALDRPRTATALVWAMLAVIGLSHLGTFYYEWRAAPYRALAFADMNRALLNSVPTEDAAALLQSPLAHARQGVEVMRARQLAVYEGHPEMRCSGAEVHYGQGWRRPEVQGRWLNNEGSLVLPASCACDFVADFYVPQSFHARRIEVRREGSVTGQWTLLPGRTTSVELGKAGTRTPIVLLATPSPEQSPAGTGGAEDPTMGALLTSYAVRCAVPATP
ncbi:MAG: hypothetical protein ACREPD_08675 [Stenotrophomonas sp.]|uniref:hypothetical protein n=1 Tax=Stenotrophomonas sp. TaxID=69392 RepID=UPI003D6D2F23